MEVEQLRFGTSMGRLPTGPDDATEPEVEIIIKPKPTVTHQ
jgi:hypothetical protein